MPATLTDAELSATYELNPDWEISGAYTLLQMDILDAADVPIDGASPNNQVYVHSAWNLPNDWEFDLIGRYVDSLPALGVSSYTTMDVRSPGSRARILSGRSSAATCSTIAIWSSWTSKAARRAPRCSRRSLRR